MKINFFVTTVLAITSAATDLKNQPTGVMKLSQVDADLASSYADWDQSYSPLCLAQEIAPSYIWPSIRMGLKSDKKFIDGRVSEIQKVAIGYRGMTGLNYDSSRMQAKSSIEQYIGMITRKQKEAAKKCERLGIQCTFAKPYWDDSRKVLRFHGEDNYGDS